MVSTLKKNWVWIAVLAGVGWYIYSRQQSTASPGAPAGGAQP
jgi:hypothetical protein